MGSRHVSFFSTGPRAALVRRGNFFTSRLVISFISYHLISFIQLAVTVCLGSTSNTILINTRHMDRNSIFKVGYSALIVYFNLIYSIINVSFILTVVL